MTNLTVIGLFSVMLTVATVSACIHDRLRRAFKRPDPDAFETMVANVGTLDASVLASAKPLVCDEVSKRPILGE